MKRSIGKKKKKKKRKRKKNPNSTEVKNRRLLIGILFLPPIFSGRMPSKTCGYFFAEF
jgi:hypothetical protein